MKRISIILWIFVLIFSFQPIDGEVHADNGITFDQALLDAFDESLQYDLLYPYYPTAEDADGGFVENRSSTWELEQDSDKFVVTQARYTWTAAKASQFYADNTTQAAIYLNSANVGFAFLQNMWGLDYGEEGTGIAMVVDRDGSSGRVDGHEDYIVYGHAFALYAASAYYAASGEQDALDLAVQIYNFLDDNAYDPVYGGYYFTLGDLRKDTNVNLHVLEALIEFYQALPESHELRPEVADRLNELLACFHDKAMHYEIGTDCFTYPVMSENWSSTSNDIQFGHDVELAFLMVEAIAALGQDPLTSPYFTKIRNMVDFTFTHEGYRGDGALYYGGTYDNGNVIVTEPDINYWLQAEALNAAGLMSMLFPDNTFYADTVNLTWSYIDSQIIDHTNHGWVALPGDWGRDKATKWHANYHDGRALMNCLKWLSTPTIDWSVRLCDSIIEIYTPDTFGPWDYTRGLVLESIWRVYQRTGNNDYYDFIKSWVDRFVTSDGLDTNIVLYSLDNMMPGVLLCHLYQATGDNQYKTAAQQIRNRIDTYPRTSDGGLAHRTSCDDQLWLDGAFMLTIFLSNYGEVFDDATYCNNECSNQLIIYNSHLQHVATKLAWHAWDEDGSASWADPTTHLSPEVWCRGLGWYVLACTEVIEKLPLDHPNRQTLIDILVERLEGIKNYQDSTTGLWYQVVDKGNLTDNWVEQSGSCMYTYALSKAIDAGYVSSTDYYTTAKKGYEGIMSEIELDATGEVINVYGTCVGTGVGDDYSYYINRAQLTNDFKGYGAFLFANEQQRTKYTDLRQLYQAEKGTLYNAVTETSNRGFTGASYVNFYNEVGSYIEITLNAASTETKTLLIRYANGTTDDRPMKIYVNGNVVDDSLSFIPSGAWSAWKPQTISVSLNAGDNVIKFESITDTGGPNLDWVTFDTVSITQTTLTRGPYLQSVTPTSILIVWDTDEPTDSEVEYGLTAEYGNTVSDSALVTRHVALLEGLSPYTTYHYRVGTSTYDLSEDITLKTAADSTQTQFNFVVYGDCRHSSDSINHQSVVDGIISVSPDFYLNTGDLVNDGDVIGDWNEFFDVENDLMKTTTLFPALGNHERDHANYFNLFYLPGNERWYSFNYGHAHFVCLQIDGYADYIVDSAQYVWLEQDLANNTQPWTFVCFHIPPYSSGAHGSDLNVRAALQPLFDTYGVDMVFNGHDHDYERSIVNGVTYLVSGGGGASLHERQQWNDWTLYFETTYHFIPISIDGDMLTGIGVRPDGSKFDSFAIEKTPTPPTMETIVEAGGQYYNTAPILSNFGFDDNVALNDGWYQMDSFNGTWEVLFSDVSGVSWDDDGWIMPGFNALSEGSHTIYFMASDDAGYFEGESGEWCWQFFKDTIPPGDPGDVSSTSHTPGAWSGDNTIDITWTGAIDNLSGIDGYSIMWDTSANTIPDQTKDIEEVTAATSPPLPDGNNHYFHISSVDNAGNWQSTIHLGPLFIAATSPVLSDGTVSPASGDTSVNFTYSANYTDFENEAPASITISIDGGTSVNMTAAEGQDGDFTNGEIYEYITIGEDLGVGSHTFQFAASDGTDNAIGDIGSHPGPTVSHHEPEPGDADGDGVIDIFDMTKVARIILGLDSETPGADANQDGEVNVFDMTKIARIILELD